MPNALLARTWVFVLCTTFAFAAQAYTAEAFAEGGACFGGTSLEPVDYYATGFGTFANATAACSTSVTLGGSPRPSIAATAQYSGLPTSSDDTDIITSSGALAYTFRVVGPAAAAPVPLRFRGNVAGMFSALSSDRVEEQLESTVYLPSSLRNVTSVYGSTALLPPSRVFGYRLLTDYSFSAALGAAGAPLQLSFAYLATAEGDANTDYRLLIDLTAQIVEYISSEASTTSMSIDSFIAIDPDFLAAHPDYSIVVEAGIGNAVSAVDEPPLLPSLVVGLGVLAPVVAARKKRAGSRRA